MQPEDLAQSGCVAEQNRQPHINGIALEFIAADQLFFRP